METTYNPVGTTCHLVGTYYLEGMISVLCGNEELILRNDLCISLSVCLLRFNARAAIIQLYSDDEHEVDDKMNMK